MAWLKLVNALISTSYPRLFLTLDSSYYALIQPPMDQENELALETTAYMQLLDLEDRRAELMPDDPTRSELEITYDIIEVDIQATLQSIRDRRIARAIHGAGRAADSLLINTIAQNELRAQNERERLLRLSRRSSRPSESSSSPGSSSSSDRSSASDSEPSDPSSPSSSISRLPGPIKRTEVNVPPVLRLPDGRDTVECIICSDLTAAAYQAPCGCFYDRNCIIKLFTKAMDDESMFPPRCCTQIIPLDQVRPILSSELIQTFKQKETEFSTPNRLYCSNRASLVATPAFVAPILRLPLGRTSVNRVK
ncbi:unnamed protein product, partial [Rhizoctonia solani]